MFELTLEDPLLSAMMFDYAAFLCTQCENAGYEGQSSTQSMHRRNR
jgi:hypothetical protein